MKSNETKTYGSIRKIKAYGTCGVILGLAALAVATTNGVQADDGANAVATQNWDSIIVENGQLVSID